MARLGGKSSGLFLAEQIVKKSSKDNESTKKHKNTKDVVYYIG